MSITEPSGDRARAVAILTEFDPDIPKRDWAYYTLIACSSTREEWEETAEFLKIARHVLLESDDEQEISNDLRPGVRLRFEEACRAAGHPDLIPRVLDSRPRNKLRPASWDLLVASDKELRARRRAAHPG